MLAALLSLLAWPSDRRAAEVAFDLRTGERWYGRLLLGPECRPFVFALDVAPDGERTVWFDEDGDDDLTDEAALANEGSGLWAAEIAVPTQALYASPPWTGEHVLWLYSNEACWARSPKRLAHYSRTQLAGTVTHRGASYPAIAADKGSNDASFAAHEVRVDWNRDGTFAAEEGLVTGAP